MIIWWCGISDSGQGNRETCWIKDRVLRTRSIKVWNCSPHYPAKEIAKRNSKHPQSSLQGSNPTQEEWRPGAVPVWRDHSQHLGSSVLPWEPGRASELPLCLLYVRRNLGEIGSHRKREKQEVHHVGGKVKLESTGKDWEIQNFSSLEICKWDEICPEKVRLMLPETRAGWWGLTSPRRMPGSPLTA